MSIETRIKNIQEYTKNQEKMVEHLVLYQTIEVCLSQERSDLEKQGKGQQLFDYHVEIVLAEEPFRVHIDFTAHEDFEALVHIYSQLEKLGGIGYELYQKQRFSKTLVKEWWPDCGLLYAKFYDPNRIGFTNESTKFKTKIASYVNKEIGSDKHE
jgi:hypothetical protein